MKPEKKTTGKPLGLYIHVPFCKSKCVYCDFYSLPNAEARMDAYVKAVCAHLAETAPQAAHHSVDTVYFGGGTPTYLGAKRLCRLLKTVDKHYHLDKDAEITFEANPDSALDWRALRSLRRAGFNRMSLGMQSADDAELKALGRVHTFAQVGQAVEAARKAKLPDVSLDLIYGLPGQTAQGWRKNVEAALALAPEHLSCYGLKVEEGTPLFKTQATANLPDDEAQADMYLWTVACLKDAGYRQYEISNFAKPGHESRHNLKYWTLGEYAGFGPGAHSDFGGVRYAYDRDLEGYIQGVLEGHPMVSESEVIPPPERDTEYLMLRLRTHLGLDPKEFERTFRRRFTVFEPLLKQYAQAGYAVEDEGCWRLTPKGYLVSNQIIGALLDALAEEKARRQAAVERGDFRVENL